MTLQVCCRWKEVTYAKHVSQTPVAKIVRRRAGTCASFYRWGRRAGQEEGAKLNSSDVPVRKESSCPLLTVLLGSGDIFVNDDNSEHSAERGPANLSQAEGALEDGFASLKNLLVEQIREGQG